ncbi:MAG: ribonuclease HII [Bacteroidales bacterium]
MLLTSFTKKYIEAGCDEAGRGCLAGPVCAAAVVLPHGYRNDFLTDSKLLLPEKRELLRKEIEKTALAYSVVLIDNQTIDEINILNATFEAMNQAVLKLKQYPELLLIDGNRFLNKTRIPFECVIKGDQKYLSIAAASVLAKTYRDDYMRSIHPDHPIYNWYNNKGYPTIEHRRAIAVHGTTPYHRKSFSMGPPFNLFT